MIMTAIDDGVDCTLDMDGEFAYTCDYYYTSSSIHWDISFEFHNIDNYIFSMVINDSENYSYNVTSVTFENGTSSIDFNSNYIDNVGFGGINLFYPYKSEFSDERNQKYEELKEMLKEDGDITIIANGDPIITLTPEQKQTLKDYFDMFDAVIIIMEN